MWLGWKAGQHPGGALLVLAAVMWLGFGEVGLAWAFVAIVVAGRPLYRLLIERPLLAAVLGLGVWLALALAL